MKTLYTNAAIYAGGRFAASLDGTDEGVECVGDAVFSMQYHPESASGPQDSGYLFRKFTKIMEERKNA